MTDTMSRKLAASPLLILCLVFHQLSGANAWLAPSVQKISDSQRLSQKLQARWGDDSSECAEPLPLSLEDIQRFSDLESRAMTIPFVILDALVPQQKLVFKSGDPKFRNILEYVDEEDSEIGMIGLNPYTGRPLNVGVTLHILNKQEQQNGETMVHVQGTRRFEVQGEPWMDSSNSFFLADVEIVDNRQEIMPDQLQEQAYMLFDELPELVDQWVAWVLLTEKSDEEDMTQRLVDLGPMPDTIREASLWVAALVNPIPALGVCMEIRPAMLSCRNDYDRMVLATQALQSSIDHLSGKKRLF